MQLVSLRLKHIRSYTDTTIDFPTGTTLLSGDIGSGKSTILLSIEFALFGILRGMLSGEGLLRHGEKDGSVELRFTLDGHEIVVMRSLRRSKDSVSQEAGSITIDGQLLPATAVEIKSRILEMLGYPSDLLTKSKGLIFRYTVYTPQEEMKQILLGDSEARLGTLRRVFGMDRYKRIQDNSSILLRHLRDERKKLEGVLLDWEEKKVQHATLCTSEQELVPAIEKSGLELKSVQAGIREAQAAQQALQEQYVRYLDLKKEHDLTEQHIRNLVSTQLSLQKEIPQLQSVIIQLESSLSPLGSVTIELLKTRSKELSSLIQQKRALILSLTSQQSMHQTHINTSRTLQEKIGTIDNCPTCLQVVGPEHKQTIASEQEHIMGEHHEKLSQIQGSIGVYNQEIQSFETEHTTISQKITESEKSLLQYNTLRMHKERLVSLLSTQQDATSRNQAFLNQLSTIREQMHGLEGLPVRMKESSETVNLLLTQERSLSQAHQKLVITSQQIRERIVLLEAELSKREAAHTRAGSISKTTLWLEDYFSPLMGHIERQVLGTIHREFSEHFCSWFSLLIEDSSITARLDETFTPIVTQNGYDTEISFLSGGEKTSCALAYRLSLNKVINDVVSTIKTKELLILDEPTDGFSSEQLDKVRDVLDELRLGQILIVSHETKMESFAQSVIRVTKEEGESKVEVL